MIKIKKTKSKSSFLSLNWLKKKLNSNPLSYNAWRNIFIGLIILFFGLIVFKLINLQIFQHDDKDRFIQNRIYKESEEVQKRGIIYDRNKSVLARSIKVYKLSLDGKMVADLKALEDLLTKHNINISSSNYKAIEAKKRYIPIQSNISEQTILQIKQDITDERIKTRKEIRRIEKEIKLHKKDLEVKEKLSAERKRLKEDNFACIKIEGSYKRVYPEKRLAAHVIGKVNSENKGTNGIEKFCDEQLSGENIKRQKMVINNYKSVFLDSESDKDIEVSNDVTLTIDKYLQFITEQELEKGMKKNKAKKGVAIIQNPKNGEILAMASFPNYDPGDKVGDQEYLRNCAISNSAEPGSTFKIIVLAAVLQEHLFNLSDKVNCENGSFQYAGKPITDHEKQRIITVKQILERSSNVGTAKLAIKLGEEKFYRYIRSFGFNSLTGIELTGEEKGILAETNKWSKRSLPTLSFGQELFVTPLQTIGAYSAIANGGTLLKPKIIKAIGDKEYNEVSVMRKHVISEETAYKVRQALSGVVTDGTGKSARIKGYSVGGKTGTAQKYDPKLKQYSKKKYMASFCGMIPAMNPEVVILVIYDEPNGDYYASSVTAPVFSQIAEKAVKYLNIEPDKPEELIEPAPKKGAKK